MRFNRAAWRRGWLCLGEGSSASLASQHDRYRTPYIWRGDTYAFTRIPLFFFAVLAIYPGTHTRRTQLLVAGTIYSLGNAAWLSKSRHMHPSVPALFVGTMRGQGSMIILLYIMDHH